jgi:hypothetical protein
VHLLATTGSPRGFVENSAEPDDLQAWCDACEGFYLREKGLTDAFRKFHDLQAVCSSCYVAMLARHSKPHPSN